MESDVETDHGNPLLGGHEKLRGLAHASLVNEIADRSARLFLEEMLETRRPQPDKARQLVDAKRSAPALIDDLNDLPHTSIHQFVPAQTE